MTSEPAAEARATQRLHPISLLFSIGSAARKLLLPGLLLVFFASRGNQYEIWLMIAFLPAVVAALAKYLSYRYRFGPDELVVREGIVTRNERHIPYARIQNIDLVQNPLHRTFGVAEVRLETAGGEKPEAVIRVLSLSAVEEMRARVFSGRRAPAAPAAVTPGEPGREALAGASPARMLHHLTSRDVVLFGVISNQGMVVVAALIGAAWQFDLFDRWFKGPFEARWKKLAELAPLSSPLTAVFLGLLALLAALVLLRVLSITRAFLKLHGFRLTRREDDLRAEHGLLTRVSKTIPRQRIQLLSTRATLLHRWFGRAAVQVETAGGTEADDGQSADRLWLAPLIRTEHVAALVQEVLPQVRLDELDWRPISPRARIRLFRVALLLLLATALAGLLAFGPWGVLPAVLLSPLAYLNARLYVKHAAYALAPGAVLYRSGWWVRRMSVARFSKIQALELTESPFDRRHRMASLRVDTAGAGRVGHGIQVAFLEAAEAARLMERLSHEAGRTAFRW